MAVDKESFAPVRAYLEYFRDLGVYEFYRYGAPVELRAEASAEIAPSDLVNVSGGACVPFTSPLNKPADALVKHQAGVESESFIPKPVSFNDLIALPAMRIAPADRGAAMTVLRADIGDCTRCPLAYAGRRNIVFGDGDPKARLMFVGEGPGAEEDEQGTPFVGKSGQLLTNMIQAMGLQRAQVFIANIVKCRPPANRAPEPVEANTCAQFLVRQIDVVQPEIVVALGATAATYLLGVRQSLGSLRGRWHDVRGAKALVTFHPAFLLRDPRQKGEAWKDLQMVMAEMGLEGAKSRQTSA